VRPGLCRRYCPFGQLIGWYEKLTDRVEEEAATICLLISTEKTKLMAVGECDMTPNIAIQGKNIDTVEDFCYLGSVISNNSSCDKEIRTRLGKASSVFGRLNSIWKDKGLSIGTKIHTYIHKSFFV